MRWWGWLVIAVALSIAWAGFCSVGAALDWWFGDDELNAIYGGWVAIWAGTVAIPLVQRARKRS